MHTLSLNVKHRVRIKNNPFLFIGILGELLFLELFDFSETF